MLCTCEPGLNLILLVIGLLIKNADSFVLNLFCDWLKSVGWSQLSSLHCKK